MSQVADKPAAAAFPDVLCAPGVRPMTREEYYKAGEAGIFGPEERLELIGGEVIKKVSPQRTPHATSIGLCAEALKNAFGAEFHVRVQAPMTLGPHSEPEPDVCVVGGLVRDYEKEHPKTAVLVIEVSDSSVRLDRKVKASLYAAAGIADYWLLNLPDRVLEVHREPAPMADEPFGHHYRSITRYPETATVSPLAAPGATIRVADLLPRL
jgi:Uma2 family endonuclease